MSDIIVTKRLTKYYGDLCAVDSLDLRVAQGTVYGLLGRNGAGKSTAIKMLLGMAHPSYGQAELFGEDAARLRPETRAKIAYLAEGHPLYRRMTVGQAVSFTRGFYERYRWNQPLLEQVLDHFELSPKRKIRRLSRGQQAQAALALAVASDPELLILDDPTLGLDTVVRRDFLESLIQIIQRRGRTILFSSHILGDVRAGGRPHRHSRRRRVAGRLPDRPFQGLDPQGGPGVEDRAGERVAGVGRLPGVGQPAASRAEDGVGDCRLRPAASEAARIARCPRRRDH